MHFRIIQRIIGILLAVFSITMLPPLLVSLICKDGASGPFMMGFSIILAVGLILWLPVSRINQELRIRDGFFVVILFWMVLGLAGALPFALSEIPQISLTDAVFESISGLTTTGSTVLTGLDELPCSLLYYRQQLQWLGGMGIIVLAVAILPMLGVGGMQLYRAEIPGPMKDTKLTPRITQTAKALWLIYLGLTVVCAGAYWLAGMSFFDAIAHSFSTIAIGGFSTHEESFGYFQSPLINAIGVVFMIIASINFALHYRALTRQSLTVYRDNSEFKTFLFLLFFNVLVICGYLLLTNKDRPAIELLQNGIFQVVSFATTSGFTSTDYYNWPTFIPVQLLFVSIIGGCAGSTAGGIKVIRGLLLFKQGFREIIRIVHPHAEIPVKLEHKSVPETVIDSVWGFFALYVFSFSILMVAMMITGLDQVTAFSAVSATLNNLGPGLGDVSITYTTLPDTAKWIACFSMLLGRLEIFTLVVLFTPVFWRD